MSFQSSLTQKISLNDSKIRWHVFRQGELIEGYLLKSDFRETSEKQIHNLMGSKFNIVHRTGRW